MSEPAEKVIEDTTGRAVTVLEESSRELEEDIENLVDFQDAVEEFEPVGNGSTAGTPLAMRSETKADTERVMELYRENFFSRHETPEQVPRYAEELDLSMEAADLLDEMQGVANLNQQDVLQKIKFLDSSNPMNGAYIDEVISLVEYPKALRRSVIEDIEVEKKSLEKYGIEVSQLEGRLIQVNQEYTLPLGIDEAVHVIEELEEIQASVSQLKNRRMHEIRRRSDILDPYFEKNLEEFYRGEDFGQPILYDLKQAEEAVEEAYENLTI